MFIKIYDEFTQNDEYLINPDNVCCIKHYVKTTGLQKTNNHKEEQASYFIEIYFINGNQLTLQFKDHTSYEYQVEKFNKLCKEVKESEKEQ